MSTFVVLGVECLGGYTVDLGLARAFPLSRHLFLLCFFFFSSRRRHTRLQGDWSSDVCSSDLNPPPRPFPWAWATFGVTLLSVGAYGGMWGKRWWKNRFRVVPTQVIAFIERGLNPVLLDVRTKTDLETSPLELPGPIRVRADAAARAPLNLEPEQMIVAYC